MEKLKCSSPWVKLVLFQLRGYGHPQDDATPIIFPDSKSSSYKLSNDVFIVSDFFKEIGEKRKQSI